jgi:uncharacterized protein (TIGR01777 family)
MTRRVAVAGSSGLIGTALVDALTRRGDSVVRILRTDSPPRPAHARPDPIRWDLAVGLDDGALSDVDAVVNLCGAPIAGQRWTGVVKQQLRDSRIDATVALTRAAARDAVPVLLNASAVGIYGDAGEEWCIDTGPDATAPGEGFLARLCVDWEAATAPPRSDGAAARTVRLRFGHVLSERGGMLPVLSRVHRFGLGGRLGSGRQWLPWITLADAVRAVLFALDGDLDGPVNVCAPEPVRQAAFSELLGRRLSRPAPWVVPRSALRLAVGELADEGLLVSQRAAPRALTAAGFRFAQPVLGPALATAAQA